MSAHQCEEPGRGRRRPSQLFYQICAAALLNGYVAGFGSGRIFTGKSKAVCVPVLNCYSCPGALGSCPVGALQAEYGQRTFPFYVLGTLMVFGALFGRLVCGLICPFGFVQDLLHRIPLRKWKVNPKADKAGRKLKYVVLAVMLIILPLIALAGSGVIEPYFCKYICPAGTLEASIPLMIADPRLRAVAGALFDWKVLVLAVIVVLSVKIHRPFCKYLCPLGAFYSFFNKFSFYHMSVDRDACIDCGKCREVCPMDVDVTADANSPECIRCGKCRDECPVSAIDSGFRERSGAGRRESC